MKARGFTLLELLVAITVLSIVSIIAWRGLDSLVRTRERLEPEAIDVRALLSDLRPDGARPVAGDQSEVPRALARPRSSCRSADGSTMLQLARIAPATADRPTEVQTVFYRVVDGTLVRQATAALPGFQTIPTDRLESARLLTNVRTLYVRTWSPNGGWVDPNARQDPAGGAAATANAVVPGVEVTIERGDGTTFRRVLLVGA